MTPRGFTDDFKNETEKLVAIFEQLRQGPWPKQEDEHLIAGSYKSPTQRIHIPPTPELLKIIAEKYESRFCIYFQPEGCPEELITGDIPVGRGLCEPPMARPGALRDNLDLFLLALFGLELVHDFLKTSNPKHDLPFTIRTWGRIVRVEINEIVILAYIVRDPGTPLS